MHTPAHPHGPVTLEREASQTVGVIFKEVGAPVLHPSSPSVRTQSRLFSQARHWFMGSQWSLRPFIIFLRKQMTARVPISVTYFKRKIIKKRILNVIMSGMEEARLAQQYHTRAPLPASHSCSQTLSKARLKPRIK